VFYLFRYSSLGETEFSLLVAQYVGRDSQQARGASLVAAGPVQRAEWRAEDSTK